MGKTIKINEEQAKKLFGGADFLRFLKEEEDRRGYSSEVGFPQKERDDDSKSTTYQKMRNLGATNLGRRTATGDAKLPNLGDNFANAVVKLIYQINGGPVNIIDALEVVNKLKGEDLGKTLKNSGIDLGEDVKSFLDTLDIATIFSNYLIIDQPDYVYYRLQHLTPQEISTIKETYGRDFKTWGTKCDGCGLQVWKTNVFTTKGDDAHINLEYMGSQGKSSDGTQLGEMKTYRIPFQIHHMNEVPSDNSPLNLSCLCPNCHSLTGSYGVNKQQNGMIDVTKLRELEDKKEPLNVDAVANEIKSRLKQGYFQDKHLAALVGDKSMEAAGISREELNEMINSVIAGVVSVKESGKIPRGQMSEPVKIGSISDRDFYIAYYAPKNDRKLYAFFYNDANIKQQMSPSSNFNPPQLDVTNIDSDPEERNRLSEFLSSFVTRTLVSTEKNISRTSAWDKPTGDMRKVFAHKDPETYRDEFTKAVGIDPVTGEVPASTEKGENYRKGKEIYNNATSDAERKVGEKLMATPDNVSQEPNPKQNKLTGRAARMANFYKNQKK